MIYGYGRLRSPCISLQATQLDTAFDINMRKVLVDSRDIKCVVLDTLQLAQLKEAEGAIDGEAADEIANLRCCS